MQRPIKYQANLSINFQVLRPFKREGFTHIDNKNTTTHNSQRVSHPSTHSIVTKLHRRNFASLWTHSLCFYMKIFK